jgi:hypothetical protein
MKETKAKFVKEITVIDPDSKLHVELAVYKHENGGMFAIDSSFIEQIVPDEEDTIYDPLAPMGEPTELYLTE